MSELKPTTKAEREDWMRWETDLDEMIGLPSETSRKRLIADIERRDAILRRLVEINKPVDGVRSLTLTGIIEDARKELDEGSV